MKSTTNGRHLASTPAHLALVTGLVLAGCGMQADAGDDANVDVTARDGATRDAATGTDVTQRAEAALSDAAVDATEPRDTPSAMDSAPGTDAMHASDAGTDAMHASDTGTDAMHASDAGTDAMHASDAGSGTTTVCWPFDRPSIATLRASSHKVFAHYFSAYPLSLDNQPAATDYYTRNYLNPAGEGGAHAYCGGLLRERPVPQTPWPAGSDWDELDMEVEVRRAVAIGLDGFTFDVLNPTPGSAHRTRLDDLLTAAQHVDAGFRIQLVFDMTTSAFGGGGGTDDDAWNGIATIMNGVGSNPALQRLADGRIVVSVFDAETRSAAFWQSTITRLAAMGHAIAFVPMTIGGWSGNRAHFASVPMYGASSWGVRTVTGAASIRTDITNAHAASLLYMAPVAPQDSRPKDLTYVEADNSAAFRAQWDAAIGGGADWVQLITWGDYSEDTEIEPSSQTHTAFYDLSAYYITWFKTGVQPRIARDALLYFHRAQDMNVAPTSAQRSPYRPVNGPTTASNQIEVVGMLTAPATLRITVSGHTYSQDVAAGVQSFRVPLIEGTPRFQMVRGGATVVDLTSATPISNTITYQDPLYHAGSSLTCAQ